jgi:hypothetical protein
MRTPAAPPSPCAARGCARSRACCRWGRSCTEEQGVGGVDGGAPCVRVCVRACVCVCVPGCRSITGVLSVGPELRIIWVGARGCACSASRLPQGTSSKHVLRVYGCLTVRVLHPRAALCSCSAWKLPRRYRKLPRRYRKLSPPRARHVRVVHLLAQRTVLAVREHRHVAREVEREEPRAGLCIRRIRNFR